MTFDLQQPRGFQKAVSDSPKQTAATHSDASTREMPERLFECLTCPHCDAPMDAPRSPAIHIGNCPDCGTELCLELIDGQWHVDASPLRTPVVVGHWGGSSMGVAVR